MAPWCSGLTCQPVTLEIEGSNPFGVAIINLRTVEIPSVSINLQDRPPISKKNL